MRRGTSSILASRDGGQNHKHGCVLRSQAKVLVFLSTCKQVKFVFEAFRRLRPGAPLRCIHGKMKQMKRMAAFYEFSEVGRHLPFMLKTLLMHVACWLRCTRTVG